MTHPTSNIPFCFPLHYEYLQLDYMQFWWKRLFVGKPLPKVTWFRNDVEVSNASSILPSAGTTHVRSELKVSGLGRKDVHSELTCQATNNPRTQPLAATLHVDMNCKFLAKHERHHSSVAKLKIHLMLFSLLYGIQLNCISVKKTKTKYTYL